MSEPKQISQETILENFSRSLRRYVGGSRPYSVAQISRETGIPPSTIKSYQEGRALPGTVNLLRLVAALPPQFADEVVEPASLAVIPRGYEEMDPQTLIAEMATVLSELTAALADQGRISHRERLEIAPTLRGAAQKMLCYAGRPLH